MAFNHSDAIEKRLKSQGYEELEPFFVLREALIDDERAPGQKVKLDRERLEEIATIQNKRIEETGDATPVIIGHTKRGLPEAQQPKRAGWAIKFQVAPFFDTGTYGLMATPWATEKDKQAFKDYPRRSAELWTNPDLLDPISLLGANTPRLDLGPHYLHRQGNADPETYTERKPLVLEMCSMADDNKTSDADKPAGKDPQNSSANAGNSSELSQMKAMLDKIMGLLGPIFEEQEAGGGMGGPPGGGMGAPDMGGMGGLPGGGAGGPPPGPPTAAPMQAMAGAGPMPAMNSPGGGGMNGMIPQQYGMGYSAPYLNSAGYPMQFANANGYPAQYPVTTPPVQVRPAQTAEQQQIVQLQRQVNALQLQKIETDVNHVLDDLQTKIVIDRPRDFATLCRLSMQEQQTEIQHWMATRRPVEAPVPSLQLSMNDQRRQPVAGGPVKLDMNADFGLAGDPALLGTAPPPPMSDYEQLAAAVRSGDKNTLQKLYGNRAASAGLTPTRPS